ncbi:hypothetical protein EDB86DRAFT_2831664 [Lactarius hatsudake]|nr:hypothetical protein EDB86DRAFT_2831664 [Lactarius hatsudake]
MVVVFVVVVVVVIDIVLLSVMARRWRRQLRLMDVRAARKAKAAMAKAVVRLLDWCGVDWDLETNDETKREINDDINESEGMLYIQASRYTTHWRTRGRGKGECRSRAGTTSKERQERRMNTNESKGDGREHEKRKERRGDALSNAGSDGVNGKFSDNYHKLLLSLVKESTHKQGDPDYHFVNALVRDSGPAVGHVIISASMCQ